MNNAVFRPFQFYTEMCLIQMTGERAINLAGLLERLKEVSGSVIYCHTFQTMLLHHFITTGFRNDFAIWVEDALGDNELAERLSSIDLIEYTTIRSYREKMIGIIEDHLKKNPSATKRTVREGREFSFCSSLSFVIPSNREAHSLENFANHLRRCSTNSMFFHFIEARLRVGMPVNDFSVWLAGSMGMDKLAERINNLNPYSRTMDGLRERILELVEIEL